MWTRVDDGTKVLNACVLLFLATALLSLSATCSGQTGTKATKATKVTPARDTLTSPSKSEDARLPKTLKPLNYDLEIQPYMNYSDPKDFTYRGKVGILLRCKTATSKVTLHRHILEVIDSTIKITGLASNGSDPSCVGVEKDEEKQFLTILLDQEMQAGRDYFVEMEFESPLRKDNTGFYYSSYKRNGSDVYVASTQFSPVFARKAFPCMDEPALKATFNITIVRPATMLSLSNMPAVDSSRTWYEHGIQYVADKYDVTPVMSTYLTAFVICDYEYIQNQTKRGLLFRAWAQREKIEEVRYSLQNSIALLSFLEDYLTIPFELPKEDMISIPAMKFAAMENWGLITYSYFVMEIDPNHTKDGTQIGPVGSIAHELAHQWFGNLVTPDFWGNVWLKEGFSTFVGLLATDSIHPDWKVLENFGFSSMHLVMEIDGKSNSHPISMSVSYPDEINKMFDSLSYSKGASIVRMMWFFLGHDTFQKGMIRYLKEYAHGNASPDDLWNALTEQTKADGKELDMKRIMDTWILQMNYPVLTVSRDINNLDLVWVKQERFVVDSCADGSVYKSPFGYKWSIPVTLTSSRNPNFNQTAKDVLWMDNVETEKTIHIGADHLPSPGAGSGWLLANVNQYGYYRVNYPTSNWEALANQLKIDHQAISVISRGQLLDDAWHFVSAGTLNIDTALKLSEYLKHERSYLTWQVALKELLNIWKHIPWTYLNMATGTFENYLRELSSDAYDIYRLNDTVLSDASEAKFQMEFATLACQTGNRKCLSDASRLFDKIKEDPHSISSDDIRSVVYCNGVRNGGWSEWRFVYQRFLNATEHWEMVELLRALACSQTPWILNNLLNMLVDADNPTFGQKWAYTVFSAVSANALGRRLAWDLVRANYDKLKAVPTLPSILSYTTISFNTEFKLKQIENFMRGKEGRIKKALEKAAQNTRSNIEWVKTNVPIIKKFFKERSD